MRVIHVIQWLDPARGGPPIVATSLAAAQAQFGQWIGIVSYDVNVNARDASRPDPVPPGSVPHSELIHLSQLPPPGAIERITASRAGRHLNGLINRGDVLHLHGVWDPLVRGAADVARRRGIPYVITPHGMLDPWSLQQRKWKKKLALLMTYRRMLNGAAFLHALNADEARLIEPLKLTCPVKIVPNGVFMEEIEPLPPSGSFYSEYPQLEGRPYVLFMSRLHYKKGLDILADAFASIASRFGDLQLVIAGPDDGAEADFERRVAGHGLRHRVHLTGPIYGHRKLAAFGDCTIFCLPSRQEGFSMAITEALGCGAPVVITETCHFPEVAEADAGEVVATDSTAVAGALGRLLDDSALRTRMGRAGRELVKSRFTWPNIASRTMAAYEQELRRCRVITAHPEPTVRPLRCVHYLADIRLDRGGLSQSVLDMCGLLASRGHHITLATCDPADIPNRWDSGAENVPRLFVVEPTRGPQGMLGSRSVSRIADLVQTADLIHLHTPWELGNLQIARACRRRHSPYLVTIHGMLDDWSMAQRSLKKRMFLSLMGRKFLEGAAAVHFTADSEFDQASKWFRDLNWAVAPCMFDLDIFKTLPGPAPAREAFDAISSTEPNILFLSRVHPKKGLELLLEATAVLHRKGVPCRVLVAGPPEARYQSVLNRLVDRLDLAGHVYFLGMVRDVEKLSLYQAADVFVLPTSQENFGLVLLESLACGTPVITTRGVDIWEQLQSGGAVIVDRTARAIAEALERLLAERNLIEDLGRRGREWVFDYQRPDRVARQYEQMYQQAIAAASSN